jgi:hypothetical protein
MDKYTRVAVFDLLEDYCPLAKPEDFMEVSEWYNGEGVDVTIASVMGTNTTAFTWGQLKALKKLLKQL